MARDYGKLLYRIWNNTGWTRLTHHAQYLYMALLSHPTITFAGVCEYRPRKLAQNSADWTAPDIETAAHELEAAGFLIIDRNSEEAFIRSFHRNDGCLKQPNLGTRAARDISNVSNTLKPYIAYELCRLRDETDTNLPGLNMPEMVQILRDIDPTPPPRFAPDDPSEKGSDDPSIDPSDDPSRKGQRNPSDDPSPITKNQEPRTSLTTFERKAPAHSAGADCAEAEDEQPTKRPRKTYPEAFERFWSAYPKRVAKKRAHEKWGAAVRDGADPETIVAGAVGYARLCAVEDRPDSKIKYPEGWLSSGRFEDDYDSLLDRATHSAAKSLSGRPDADLVPPSAYVDLLRGDYRPDGDRGDGPGIVDAEIVDMPQRQIGFTA